MTDTSARHDPQPGSNLSESLRRRTTKTSVLIAVDLANYIVAEGLADGTSLPHEKQMADELGVGRASIREALRLLETRGLIRIRSGPGGGPTVRRPDPGDFSSALEFALLTERASLADVLHAREDLVPFATRLAATRASAATIAELRQTLDALREGLADDETFAREARRFEALVADAGGNVVVRLVADAMVAVLWDAIPYVAYPATRRRLVLRSLEQVHAALAARDAELAERRMRTFVRNGTKYWRTAHPDLLARAVRWAG